jgi:hypothetical protein
MFSTRATAAYDAAEQESQPVALAYIKCLGEDKVISNRVNIELLQT